ncbi:MAG: DUF533 domain-containing protein [Arenimonas sp.]|nr:DUF533 domain-containing protein [Arenimonas sp.]MBP6626532.1 DUF533 domain-containing protein [Arenimonas sp.]
MFNPEKLLGQLLGDSMSGQLGGKRRSRGAGGMFGGISGTSKAQLGIGLLGIAMAAYQHYQQPAPAASPLASGGPPPPPGSAGTVPPPPPQAELASPERLAQAMHLLRAMITAAHADGLIDGGERDAILGRARQAGLGDEDLRALDAEIRAPFTLEQLAVRTAPAQRSEVYAAALLTIGADTPDELAFLDRLAAALPLEPAARRDIHTQLGIA